MGIWVDYIKPIVYSEPGQVPAIVEKYTFAFCSAENNQSSIMQKCYLYIRSLSLDFQADHFDMAIAPGIDGMCCCIVFHQLIKESIAQFRWQAVGVRKPCCSNPSSAVDGLTLIEDLHHMTHPS